MKAATASRDFDETVASLEKRLGEAKSEGSDAVLDLLVARIQVLESQASDGTTSAVQMVGTIQGMVESQGRELDTFRADVSNLRSDVATLRSDIASLRTAVHGLEAKHHGLLGGLRTALQIEASESPGKAKAAAQVPQTPPAAGNDSEAKGSSLSSEEAASDAPPFAVTGEEVGKFENVPVTTPAKFRVKREIEFNFLLERMGYRRLDSYTNGERVDEKLPGDGEIATFLATFELGCEAEEVEVVSVQRGEYQMVQYQRVDKSSGIRSWISRGRT